MRIGHNQPPAPDPADVLRAQIAALRQSAHFWVLFVAPRGRDVKRRANYLASIVDLEAQALRPRQAQIDWLERKLARITDAKEAAQ